jgi:hypothetical protein
MADRYWVGGAGTWDATTTTNWAITSGGAGGASAPTSVDNVIFDSLSNATGYTVTIGTNAVCEDLTVTGPLTGAVTFSLAATARIDCHGSMMLPATGLVWTGLTTALLTFRATTTGKTVTTNGVSLASTGITFDGVGGGWTLGSALTATSSIIVTNGNFNSGNYNITYAGIASNNSNIRSITLGSSTVTLTGSAVLTFTTSTNLTFNAGTSQITCSGATPTFAGGGQTFYNVSFTSTAGGTSTITGANTFNDLTQTSSAGQRSVSFGENQTINGTLTFGASNTAVTRIQVQSSVIGTQRTITLNGSLATLADCDFRNIATAGSVGTWTGTRLGNGLGNSGITFDAAKDVYWNLAAGGNWNSTGWALSSGGAVNVNNFPLAQDKVIIEDTGLNTSATVTINSSWWIGELDLSTRTNAMTLANLTQIPRFYKNVTLSSAVTMTGTGAWNFVGQGTTQILDVNTATFVPPITIDSATGTLQLAEDTTCSATVTLTSGTLDLSSGNRTLTCNIFSSSNTNTRVIAFGTGKIVVSGNNATVVTTTIHTNFSHTGTSRIELSYSGAVGTRAIAPGITAVTEATSLSFYVISGADIINITGNSGQNSYRTLDFTGFAGSVTGTQGVSIYRDLVFSSGMTLSSLNTFTFAATSGTQQITTNGKTLDFAITQNGIGGTVQLQDNLTMGSTRTFTLTNGSLDLDDNTLTTGLFSSSNSNTRSIAFGTGNITVTGNSGTVWSTATPTNFSRTGTPTVNISNNSATAITVGTGTMTEAQALNFNFTTGTYTLSESSSFYGSLNYTGFAGTIGNTGRTIFGNYTLSTGMTVGAGGSTTTFAATSGTQQITTAAKTMDFPLTFNGIGGTFAFQDALTQGSTRAFTITNGTVQLKDGATSTVGAFATSGTNQKFLQSTLAGTQATLSQASGTVNASYLTIQDINATGGATFNALFSNNNANGGNNNGWNFGIVPITFTELNGFKLRSFTQPRRF